MMSLVFIGLLPFVRPSRGSLEPAHVHVVPGSVPMNRIAFASSTSVAMRVPRRAIVRSIRGPRPPPSTKPAPAAAPRITYGLFSSRAVSSVRALETSSCDGVAEDARVVAYVLGAIRECAGAFAVHSRLLCRFLLTSLLLLLHRSLSLPLNDA